MPAQGRVERVGHNCVKNVFFLVFSMVFWLKNGVLCHLFAKNRRFYAVFSSKHAVLLPFSLIICCKVKGSEKEDSGSGLPEQGSFLETRKKQAKSQRTATQIQAKLPANNH